MKNSLFGVATHDCHQTNDVSPRQIGGPLASVICSHVLVEYGFPQTVRDVKPKPQDAEEYARDRDENHEVPRRETAGPKGADDARVLIVVHERRDDPQMLRNNEQTPGEFGNRIVRKNAHDLTALRSGRDETHFMLQPDFRF
jgi:hypothetical protein